MKKRYLVKQLARLMVSVLVLQFFAFSSPVSAAITVLPAGCPGVLSDYNIVEDGSGGNGKDLIVIGDNNTSNISGGNENDCIVVGSSNSGTISGGNGADTIIVGDDNSGVINGNNNDDTITVGSGTYTIDGGNGTDSCTASSSGVTFSNCETEVIVSDPTTGSLTVTKVSVGGDGTFEFTGDAGEFEIITEENSGSETIDNLEPGNYSVTETEQEGWDETTNDCVDVEVVAGETASCTITNTKRGSITVIKDVVAPDGETEVSDDHEFSVTLNDDDEQIIAEGDSHTYENLEAGEYTIAELEDDDYELVSITGDGTVTVNAGENVEVTITNKQKSASLTVVKQVTNHGIGSLTPEDFTMNVEGTNVSSSSFSGDDSGVTVTLDPGEFSVGEVAVDGYAMSLSGDCSGTIGSNEELTCTVTNSDIPFEQGAITVIKQVVNDNGGTKDVDDFELYITPFEATTTVAISGQANFLDPGSYTISEGDLPEGYSQTSINCTNGEISNSGEIELTAQEAWVCTIINDDQPGSLTIVKQTDGYDATFEFTISETELEPSITTVEGSGEITLELDKGSYDIQEVVPEGWDFVESSCEYDGESEGEAIENGESIYIGNGESVTCTFENSRQTGTLIVQKFVVNDDEIGTSTASMFSFMIDGGEAINFEETEDVLFGENQITLPTGIYTVTESATEGYTTTYENCSEIEITNGEETICTITNDDNTPQQEEENNGGGGGGGGGGSQPQSGASVSGPGPIINVINALNQPLTIGSFNVGNFSGDFGDLGHVDLHVPAGAVDGNTTFTVSVSEASQGQQPQNTTGAFMVGNTVFNITATDENGNEVNEFDELLTITLALPGLPEDTASLDVYFFDTELNAWVLVEGAEFDPITGEVVFTVDHLTLFAVISGNGQATLAVNAPQAVLGAQTFGVGVLLRTPNGRIYEVKANGLYHIKSLTELQTNYRGRPIIEVSEEDIADYTILQGKTYAVGALLRTPNKRIYEVKVNGVYHVLNLAELVTKYFGKPIHDVTEEILALYR